MRKTFFILLLILAAGCTKNSHSLDDVQQLDAYIFFDAGVTETKGNLLEGEALPAAGGTAFGVSGYKGTNTPVFDAVTKVYRPEDGAGFIYDNPVQWTDESHSFYAYYPYGATCITGCASDETGAYITYALPSGLDGMTDILTATTGAVTYNPDNPLVQLEFNHRMFALDVIVKNTQVESGKEIEINSASIAFSGLAATVTLYFNGTVTPGTSQTTFSHNFNISDATTIASGKEYSLNAGNSFLLLPCAALQATVELTIKSDAWDETVPFILDYTGDNAIAPTGGGGFLAGHKYSLVINKGDKGISFTIEDEGLPWEGNDDIGIGFN